MASSSCGGVEDPLVRSTVARNRTVTVPERSEYARFFEVLHGVQVALNEAEHVRLELLAQLGDRMTRNRALDIAGCASIVRLHADAIRSGHGTVVITYTPPPADYTIDPVSGQPRPAFPPAQEDVERMIPVAVRLEGTGFTDDPALARALEKSLASAVALEARMTLIDNAAGPLRTAARDLHAQLRARIPNRAAELDREFVAAETLLDDAPARARSFIHIARMYRTRLEAAASARTTTPPPVGPDAALPTDAALPAVTDAQAVPMVYAAVHDAGRNVERLPEAGVRGN